MKAILVRQEEGESRLVLGEAEKPRLKDTELLVRVEATALNRADLLQKRGLYPPPPGASEILGLEMSGEVVEIGASVKGWHPGDRVFALLPGGGYAEYAAVPAEMAMRIPDSLSFVQAAAIPEVFLTAYLNLFWLGGLSEGMRVLIHAGASGVGTAAIQLVREAGAEALVTAGSDEKLQRCMELGAAVGWNYRSGSFLPWLKRQTQDAGVQLILDFVGAPYFHDNLQALARDGKLIVIGTLGGSQTEGFNMAALIAKRLQIIGTALRSQPLERKIKLTCEFADFALPRFADGRLEPVIDRIFAWQEAEYAHEYLESNANIGKIVLKMHA